jgi:hypothetical protein
MNTLRCSSGNSTNAASKLVEKQTPQIELVRTRFVRRQQVLD